MSIQKEAPFNSKRFIGDAKSKKVHDFQQMNCLIDKDYIKTFDSIEEAHSAGFKNCHICFQSNIFINQIDFSNYKASDSIIKITKAEGAIVNKITKDSSIKAK